MSTKTDKSNRDIQIIDDAMRLYEAFRAKCESNDGVGSIAAFYKNEGSLQKQIIYMMRERGFFKATGGKRRMVYYDFRLPFRMNIRTILDKIRLDNKIYSRKYRSDKLVTNGNVATLKPVKSEELQFPEETIELYPNTDQEYTAKTLTPEEGVRITVAAPDPSAAEARHLQQRFKCANLRVASVEEFLEKKNATVCELKDRIKGLETSLDVKTEEIRRILDGSRKQNVVVRAQIDRISELKRDEATVEYYKTRAEKAGANYEALAKRMLAVVAEKDHYKAEAANRLLTEPGTTEDHTETTTKIFTIFGITISRKVRIFNNKVKKS